MLIIIGIQLFWVGQIYRFQVYILSISEVGIEMLVPLCTCVACCNIHTFVFIFASTFLLKYLLSAYGCHEKKLSEVKQDQVSGALTHSLCQYLSELTVCSKKNTMTFPVPTGSRTHTLTLRCNMALPPCHFITEKCRP